MRIRKQLAAGVLTAVFLLTFGMSAMGNEFKPPAAKEGPVEASEPEKASDSNGGIQQLPGGKGEGPTGILESTEAGEQELPSGTDLGSAVPASFPWLPAAAGLVAGLAIGASALYVVNKKNQHRKTEEIVFPSSPDHGVNSQETGSGQMIKVGKVHNIGRRSSQQDSFGISDMEDPGIVKEKGVLALVADGMGGLQNGGEVSSRAAVAMLQYFHENPPCGSSSLQLLRMLQAAVLEVNRYLGPSGLKKSGSTLVAVIIKDQRLDWISVGDSHIYLYRGGALIQINRDHIYAVELDERAARGEITVEQAMNDRQRNSLTSYLGMGELNAIDRSFHSVQLRPKDRVLLMSDGVYGTLSEEEMAKAMELPVEESALCLNQMIIAHKLEHQDNYTAVILECC